MKSAALIIGSLSGPLARAQAQTAIDRIHEVQPRLVCQLNVLTSPVAEADKADLPFLAMSLDEMEYLADVLRREEARLLVAEASDLPLPLPDDLEMICIPDRSAPFDAFLNRQGLIMDEMDPGSVVGVLSLRSRTQMQALWPDLKFRLLRGGVDRAMETHMRRSEIDGLVLPASVTEYLGIQGIVSEIFSPDFILPGPGQGTLVLVGRRGDAALVELLAGLHSEASALELQAELAFRSRMISDLDPPLGALARVRGSELAIVGATGKGTLRISVSGDLAEAEAVGSGLAQQILSSVESFADLLEADFPEGLPADLGTDEDGLDDDLNGVETDEDLFEEFESGGLDEDDFDTDGDLDDR